MLTFDMVVIFAMGVIAGFSLNGLLTSIADR